jgi:hypothetical protein
MDLEKPIAEVSPQMRSKRIHLVMVGALALSLTVGLCLCDSAAAKKKGGAKAAIVSGIPGAIPNGPTTFSPSFQPTTSPVALRTTATVGNKFKKKTVGDVDATVSLTGVPRAGTSCGGVCDMRLRLTAPNGAQTALVVGGAGVGRVTGNLVSNLTLSDQTPTLTCGGPFGAPSPPPPPCGDPDATLLAPYTGTAQPGFNLNLLNGSPIKGTWTLTGFDFCGAPACGDQGTSTVTAWSLKITPATAPK